MVVALRGFTLLPLRGGAACLGSCLMVCRRHVKVAGPPILAPLASTLFLQNIFRASFWPPIYPASFCECLETLRSQSRCVTTPAPSLEELLRDSDLLPMARILFRRLVR